MALETEEEEERRLEGWPEVEGTRDHLFEVERFKHKSRGKHHGPPSGHLDVGALKVLKNVKFELFFNFYIYKNSIVMDIN